MYYVYLSVFLALHYSVYYAFIMRKNYKYLLPIIIVIYLLIRYTINSFPIEGAESIQFAVLMVFFYYIFLFLSLTAMSFQSSKNLLASETFVSGMRICLGIMSSFAAANILMDAL